MNDTTANGKVDQVTMTWSETVATYSAGTTPWTLNNVPSGGTLTTAAATTTTGTLTIAEGAGAADTAVGAFSISLAASPTGIRDAAGNQTSFTGVVPQDKARPIRLTTQAFDDDVNGKFDRVLVTFTEALANYTAGTTPWTMTSPPAGMSIASVTVPGGSPSATLALNESTTPLTSIGSWRITLASNAAGIRDAAGNLSTGAAVAPTDRAAPVLRTATMQDLTGADGYVDRVALLFSETLMTYTAGTTPWTLANAPSGSSVSAAAVTTATVNLTLATPTTAPDTAVGAFTVSMAANAAGVRDTAGNITAAFGPVAPIDGAAPVPASFTTTVTGATPGRFETGDAVALTLSEPLALSVNLTSPITVTLTDPTGGGNDTLAIPGLFSSGRATGSNTYQTNNNTSASFTGSTITALGRPEDDHRHPGHLLGDVCLRHGDHGVLLGPPRHHPGRPGGQRPHHDGQGVHHPPLLSGRSAHGVGQGHAGQQATRLDGAQRPERDGGRCAGPQAGDRRLEGRHGPRDPGGGRRPLDQRLRSRGLGRGGGCRRRRRPGRVPTHRGGGVGEDRR